MVLEHVRKLDAGQQQILLLRLEQGLSYREISEVTGRSEGNVGNILHHAVKDLVSGKVTITSQNHGYAIDPESLTGTRGEVTQINVNDGTVEGMSVPDADAWSIQYHPEAAPGPWDSRPYFAQFVERMKNGH